MLLLFLRCFGAFNHNNKILVQSHSILFIIISCLIGSKKVVFPVVFYTHVVVFLIKEERKESWKGLQKAERKERLQIHT